MKYILPLLLSVVGFCLANLVFDVTQSFLISTIILLISFWTNEALPFGIVSLLPVVLFPLLGILDIKSVTANYSNPIIFLFLGGFMLAIAVEKINLHKVIANNLISIFPKTPRGLIFGLTITSALLSSLLSNTTTALLLMPIAMFLSNDTKLKIRLVLAVAYGASIGGIITPIGTPPNLILLGFLEENNLPNLTFIEWMLKTIPLAFVMLIVVSFVLSFGVNHIKIEVLKEKFKLNFEQKKLVIILILLMLSLFLNSIFKIPDAIILLSFGILMFIPNVGFLEWKDTNKIPYGIIFLFGAGFSIAKAFTSTHLANEIAKLLLNMSHLAPFALLLVIAIIITFTTEITSNTALISIALPIIYSIGLINTDINMDLILMLATICASYAFMLPIATPPNAIAFSSGVLTIKEMAKFGLLLNFIAIFVSSTIAYFFW